MNDSGLLQEGTSDKVDLNCIFGNLLLNFCMNNSAL